MERETATATGQLPEVEVKAEAPLTELLQVPTTEVPAQHGPGPPASSTPSAAPEAEQQIGLLKAELAAVKQSLATYESTLQQLLGVPAVPGAIHQLQGMVVNPDDLGPRNEGTSQTAASSSAPEQQQQQQQQEVLPQAGNLSQQALNMASTALSGSQPLSQEVGSSTIVECLLAADAVGTGMQQTASTGTQQAVAVHQPQAPAATSILPLIPQVPAAVSAAPECRLQASASAPSFADQIAAASTAQQPAVAPFVQRRSTFGSSGTGYEYLLHGSPATGILSGMRPPSPHHALVSPPPVCASSRQQQQQPYLDAISSQVQQAGPSGPVSIPISLRTSSPGPGAAYSASPGFSSSMLTSHGPLGAGGLLPPLPGRQSRHSDPTFAAAAGMLSPPGVSSLISHSYAGVCTSTGLQQLSGPSLAHLGPMQADTAGSLSLSPDGLAVPAAAGRPGPMTPFESPDVMPSSSGAGADQFSGQQLQSLLQQGRGPELAAEQLAMLQQYHQQQQGLGADSQQQLLAAMSQLDLKDPNVAAVMTAAAGQAAGGLGAGLPLGGLWDPATAAAAATLAAAGGLDSSQAALQQQALQAQALASLQAQADVQAYQQAQLVQQLQQQQQQYNPYLQQLLAAQAAAAAAAAAALRQHPGQAGLWPLGYPGSSASSSSSGRRSSRGGDVQPSGARDVRKGPAGDRSARVAAAAGRQPRAVDDTPDWRRVFVGNIGWWVDEQMLQQVFAEYGTILDAQVMWNTKLLAKGKRVNREFAFISFVTPEEAGNAIRWLNGRYIEGITKDRDGLTVQFEAQGVGKSSSSQGHQPPPHLQQIINSAATGQQTQQQVMMQQLQQQQQQQGALELLVQQQQQQQWPPGGELALLQQLGLGQPEVGPQQQGGRSFGAVIFEDSGAAGGAAAPTSSSAPPAAQAGEGM